MARSKRTNSEETGLQSKLIQLLEGSADLTSGQAEKIGYLKKANWTKQQFMAEIGVGEAQYYRWARGENIPTKAVVNRIAVFLARQLDHVHQNLPHDPSPISDTIDGLLNELLEAAGYSASIKGKGIDSSWQEISNNRAWRIGYTPVDPKWVKAPERYGDNPTGIAIDCANRVGDLLGIRTEWKYLTWQEMPLAIAERKVHGIAPFILAAPGRFFDYRFSEPWLQSDTFDLSAVTLPGKFEEGSFLEDLSPERVRLVYIENEIGSWMASILGSSYQCEVFTNNAQAIGYMKDFATEKSAVTDVTPVLCIDSVTCRSVASENNWQIINTRALRNIKLYPAFALHPDEEKLTTCVNSVLRLVNSL